MMISWPFGQNFAQRRRESVFRAPARTAQAIGEVPNERQPRNAVAAAIMT